MCQHLCPPFADSAPPISQTPILQPRGDGWTYRCETVMVECPIRRMIVKASAPASGCVLWSDRSVHRRSDAGVCQRYALAAHLLWRRGPRRHSVGWWSRILARSASSDSSPESSSCQIGKNARRFRDSSVSDATQTGRISSMASRIAVLWETIRTPALAEPAMRRMKWTGIVSRSCETSILASCAAIAGTSSSGRPRMAAAFAVWKSIDGSRRSKPAIIFALKFSSARNFGGIRPEALRASPLLVWSKGADWPRAPLAQVPRIALHRASGIHRFPRGTPGNR